MTLLPTSLRGRLLATGALFIALALLATGVAVRFALYRFVQGQIDQRLDAQLLTLGAAVEPDANGRLVLSRNVDGPPFDNPRTGWFWIVRTPTDTWLAGGLHGNEVTLPEAPAGFSPHPRSLEGSGPGQRPIRARTDRIVVAGQPVTLTAAAPLDAQNGPLRDALLPLFTALVVLGSGLTAATLFQVRLGLQPLATLRDGIAAVRSGNRERLPADQPDEVRPLVVELNSLLDQHAGNLDRARRHVANLAHALKTPLAGLSLALGEAGIDPDHRLRRLTVDMDRRIRHHLARARVAALGAAARSSVDVASRVADHVAAFGKIYADRGLACRLAIPPGCTAACDPQDFDEMIGNLVDNAFKWARANVLVEAVTSGSSVRVAIADDGPGVAPDLRDAILRPGRRLDEKVAGDGFGLAIVQEMAELYGGAIELSGEVPHGLRATLTLPAGKTAMIGV